MRRLAITCFAALAVAALVPMSALARHHRERHHSRVHHARIERFGRDVTRAPATSDSADNAGTVKSFASGVLSIQLANGSTVSGAVTNDTELECMAAHAGRDNGDAADARGGDESGDGDHSRGGNGDGDHSGGGDDQSQASGAPSDSSCSTMNLSPGTIVHEAELRISSARGIWTKIEL